MTTNAPAKMSLPAKWLTTLGIVFVLYSVAGFIVVPAVIKSQMLKRLPAITKRQAAVADVKFNPYTLSLTIDGFSLKEPNGDVFSSFGELNVNFKLSSIFKGCWVFGEISLRDPFAQVIYLKGGAFNFANLLGGPAPAGPPAKSKPTPPIIIDHLWITNGALAFNDLTRKSPFNIRYQPINVSLTNFTTLRGESSSDEIVATGDSGETIDWMGQFTLNPLRSSGSIEIGGLKLSKYKPYSEDYALFEIADGQVDVSADYRYDSTTNALGLEISNGILTLTRLELKAPDTGDDVLTIPSLTVKDAEASLAARTATIGQLQSSDGSIFVSQDHKGAINFLKEIVPRAKVESTNSTPTPGAPWTVKVQDITFDNYSIKAEDQRPAKTAVFNIDKLGFSLKNVSNLSNAPVTVALSLRLQKTGLIGVHGSATVTPPWADFFVGVTNLDVRVAQPYLDEGVKMAVTRGALDVNGHAHYAPDGQGVPLASFAGDISVRDFAVTDEVLYNDLAKWDALDITGINASVRPYKFQVDQIKFSHPDTSIIRNPDGRWNFLTLVPERKTASVPVHAAPETNTIPSMTLGAFVFENASLHFADRSIEPNCTFEIQESSGSVKNISSLVQTPSPVEVKGNVDQFSPFSITGALNPMPDKLFVDVAVAFTNTGLTAFSTYTEKFVGRPLEKGKISLALHYDIKQKALNATNDVFIDQLTLGPKNGSTNATKLPVKLAIALLKDRSGRIKLNVPIHGRLDDPKFKLWPIIWQVVDNLIVKAAVSPFSLLGSMFGSGAQLSFVAFDPGQADIPAAETNKLNTLSVALYNRPGLTLEINGSADPAIDREEMIRAKFERQIKALLIKEMTAAGKSPVAANELTLAPADYARLVPIAYSNTFGAYHPPGTNQAPVVSTPLPVKKPVAAKPVFKNRRVWPRWKYEHGANLMVDIDHPSEVVQAPPVLPATQPIQVQKPTAAAPPPPVPQTELAAMEEQLLQKITITTDDFRQLMQDRATQVEAYLLKSGKVTADRLFITAPQAIGPNFKGEDRVNLTLD